jgi:hypothetical protein
MERTPVRRSAVTAHPSRHPHLVRLEAAVSVAWEHLPQPIRRVPLRLAPAPPARRRPPTAPRRRRRLLALVVALGLTVALLLVAALAVRVVVSAVAGSATAGEAPVASAVYTVVPGDTYFSIAARFHEAGDLRATVDAVVAANGGRELRPGDRIVIE